MNSQSNAEARALFMKYLGNPYFMAREGELDTYRTFAVSQNQEAVWIAELREELLAQLEREPLPAHLALGYFSQYMDCVGLDVGAIEPILKLMESKQASLDSFSKLLVAEELLDVAERGSRQRFLRARRIAKALLEEVLRESVTVADDFRSIPHLPSTFEPTTIKDRATKALLLCSEA